MLKNVGKDGAYDNHHYQGSYYQADGCLYGTSEIPCQFPEIRYEFSEPDELEQFEYPQ